MYHIELDSNLKFNSIPMGMWWASLTMTRVTKIEVAEIELKFEFAKSDRSWSGVWRDLYVDLETSASPTPSDLYRSNKIILLSFIILPLL